MIRLNEKAVQLIRNNKPLFIKVQAALSVTERTMYNYLDKNSEDLTKLSAIDVLVNESNLPLSELVNNGKLSKLMAK